MLGMLLLSFYHSCWQIMIDRKMKENNAKEINYDTDYVAFLSPLPASSLHPNVPTRFIPFANNSHLHSHRSFLRKLMENYERNCHRN